MSDLDKEGMDQKIYSHRVRSVGIYGKQWVKRSNAFVFARNTKHKQLFVTL